LSRFDNDLAWNELKSKGNVATLRNYSYKPSQNVIAKHGNEKIKSRVAMAYPISEVRLKRRGHIMFRFTLVYSQFFFELGQPAEIELDVKNRYARETNLRA
jgi:hypothetical protein